MFSKPNLSEPSITGKYCGLRYEPFEYKIEYINECFLHTINSTYIIDVYSGSKSVISNTESRITGGQDVVERESPWTVQIHAILMIKPTPVAKGCTGVLITLRHILTAAHCLLYVFNYFHY